MASQATGESSDPPQSVILCVAPSLNNLPSVGQLGDPFADGPSVLLLRKLISEMKLHLIKKTVDGLDSALW